LLKSPSGIALDLSSGSPSAVFIADYLYHKILRIPVGR
jgi:hypothetical protein